MAIIGVKTNLLVTVEAKGTPRTTLRHSIDRGSGIEESNTTTGFGSDLVTNGDFPTVTTGWTASDSVLSIDTARLKVTNNSAAQGGAYQSITTVAGTLYRLQFDFEAGDDVAGYILVGTSAGDGSIARKRVTGNGTLFFVAVGTATVITLQNVSAVDTEFNFFDNIVAQKTNGIAYVGRATDGTKANERLIRQAVNVNVE